MLLIPRTVHHEEDRYSDETNESVYLVYVHLLSFIWWSTFRIADTISIL